MGRKPRIEIEGAIYHVIQRGNNREYIFGDNKDKIYFLRIMKELMKELPFQLLGYVIMDNHYHLMVKRGTVDIYKIMQRINNQYSKNFNKQYGRSGHVFQGRYKGILVKDERYLLSLLRYIHQNPIHAHICNSVKEYRWSSDWAYRTSNNRIVSCDFILNMFSSDRKTALKQYDIFMEEKEPLEKARELFEDSDTIEDKDLAVGELQYEQIKDNLDAILLSTGVEELDFRLIKEGSRKRHLQDYKAKYVKSALAYGYSLKDIGEHIGLSGEAVRRMI